MYWSCNDRIPFHPRRLELAQDSRPMLVLRYNSLIMRKLLRVESNKSDGNLSLVHGVESEVLPRRENFLKKHGVKSDDCVFIQTEHEDKITIVDSNDKGATVSTEALITDNKNVILFLLTGDCFPVSFYDPVKGVIALAHLGWKPADKKLVAKVVQKMVAIYQSNSKDIQVYIGPGIQKESYKFIDPIQKQLPDWSDFLEDLNTGETSIDLAGFIKSQAIASGISETNINVSGIDTATSDKYFSHYRSVRNEEPEARFVTILGMV